MSGIVNDIMNIDSIMDTEDRKGKTENIYSNAETIRDVKHKHMEISKTQTPQHAESDSVCMRSSRSAPVCLALLYFLLLTAVIVLCVFIYTNNTNYTQDRNQLLTRITNITEENNKINNLTNKLNDLLQTGAWIYYQSSFYFVSNDTGKNWTESRQDCETRAAYLIIINNIQEHDFIMSVTHGKECWIGLTDSEVEGSWKWVDGTNMTSGIWATGEPNGGTKENCVVTYLTRATDLIGWIDEACSTPYQWICEKSISSLIQP